MDHFFVKLGNYVNFSWIFAELCGIKADSTTLEEVDNIFSP